MLRELWTVSPPMRVCDCSYNLQNHLTRGEQHHYRNLNSNISTWFVHAFEWCNSVSWSAVEKEKRITNLNFSRGKFQSGIFHVENRECLVKRRFILMSFVDMLNAVWNHCIRLWFKLKFFHFTRICNYVQGEKFIHLQSTHAFGINHRVSVPALFKSSIANHYYHIVSKVLCFLHRNLHQSAERSE